MKHLLAAILLLCAVSPADAQSLTCVGDRCTLMFESANSKEAHDSANDFSRLVGDRLKAQYPRQILDPRVDLTIYILNGVKTFRVVWSVRLVKTQIYNADWQFDRRGSLRPGKTLDEAAAKVEDDIRKTGKVDEMRAKYPGKKTNIPPSFVRSSYSGSSLEGYWWIKEYFMTVPKFK